MQPEETSKAYSAEGSKASVAADADNYDECETIHSGKSASVVSSLQHDQNHRSISTTSSDQEAHDSQLPVRSHRNSYPIPSAPVLSEEIKVQTRPVSFPLNNQNVSPQHTKHLLTHSSPQKLDPSSLQFPKFHFELSPKSRDFSPSRRLLCCCRRHRRKRCRAPRYLLSYLFCVLVLILALLGSVFLTLGVLMKNRDFLVAGCILSLTCVGLLLQHCLRRSPNTVLKSGHDLSLYIGPFPPPPTVVDGLQQNRRDSQVSSLSRDAAKSNDGESSSKSVNSDDENNDKTDKKGETVNYRHHRKVDQLQLGASASSPNNVQSGLSCRIAHSAPPRIDFRRPSYVPSAAEVMPLRASAPAGCYTHARPPPIMRNRGVFGGHYCGRPASSSGGVLDLARRLSVASAVGQASMSHGWDAHGSHDRHRFRRSISHPWEMSRPENHYRE